MGRLRKRLIIPEDTHIRATLTDPKIVHGNYGRQVETITKVNEGGENNEYKGVTFKSWYSFSRDKDTKEEYIAYGAPLYQLLSMVVPNLDEVLDDENLSEREYEKFIKKAVKELDDFEITARVGVKVSEKDPDKKRNVLQSGTFGPYRDPESEADEDFEALDMGEKAEEKAPF